MQQTLNRYQRVNQFPHSFELTRKDTLARNIGKMKQLVGERHFTFFPTTFILPRDQVAFTNHLSTLSAGETKVPNTTPMINHE